METQATGLTTLEANQLLATHGNNELNTTTHTSPFVLFINQFKNILIGILVIASLISFFVGDIYESVFIIVVVVLNAILGFVQEYKAENALASLKHMTSSQIRVIRDGIEQMLDSRFLVPGDIVKLEVGDKIPADGQLLTARHLEINEASLTGESLPTTKDIKANNQVYMGTIVTSGSALIRISGTGKNTKFGELAASLTSIQEQKTPLEKKVTLLGRQLTTGALVITVIIFFLGLLQGRPLTDLLLTSISLAVAAVPEGLPAAITIALAVGLQRMAKKKAILRKLGSIESLGNTTVIVTDKTGTLTENKMRILSLWTNNTVHQAKNLTTLLDRKEVYELVKAGVICNNSSVVSRDGKTDVVGESTEGSLMLLAHDHAFPIEQTKKAAHIVDEYTFDQTRKLMSIVAEENDTVTIYTKGAPESVLSRSTKFMKGATATHITAEEKHKIQKEFELFARDGLRILALAKRTVTTTPANRDDCEKDLTFLGFVGITDPPRAEIKKVLEMTRKAGITTVMVTGDNPLTAHAVARHIGLIYDGEAVVTGDELQQMSDEELLERIDKIRIFARTTPHDKLRIVKMFQKRGEIVTVTGDGVNDALAIKQANTGVAMGITGTDVAKEVADMVITDDNFASIVSAVREGRIIFDNMVKSITYLVSTNLSEILLILYTILASLLLPEPIPVPLLPIHILWINLVSDGLPALSLAFDRGTIHTMEKRLAINSSKLLGKKSLVFMIVRGMILSATAFGIFLAALQVVSVESARFITFNTLVILQLMSVFFVRREHSIFSNKILLLSILVSLGLQIIIMFVQPFPSIFQSGMH